MKEERKSARIWTEERHRHDANRPTMVDTKARNQSEARDTLENLAGDMDAGVPRWRQIWIAEASAVPTAVGACRVPVESR